MHIPTLNFAIINLNSRFFRPLSLLSCRNNTSDGNHLCACVYNIIGNQTLESKHLSVDHDLISHYIIINAYAMLNYALYQVNDITYDQLNGKVNIGSVFTIASPLVLLGALTGPWAKGGGQMEAPGGRKIASFGMAAKSWQM